MTIRLVIAYCLNLFDLAMTNHWISKYGIGIEGNPVGRWLYQTGLVYPVKIVGMGLLFWLLHKAVSHRDKGLEKTIQWWDVVSWAVLVVYIALAVYHLIIAGQIWIIEHKYIGGMT